MSASDDGAPEEWLLADEVGGEEVLREIVADFYGRVFEDAMIGFLFTGLDREALIDRQVEWARANLGAGEVEYRGTPIREAHASLPIRPGHFDRRHDLLREVLEEYGVPEHVRDSWLELEQQLRELVVRTGEEARESILAGEGSGTGPGERSSSGECE